MDGLLLIDVCAEARRVYLLRAIFAADQRVISHCKFCGHRGQISSIPNGLTGVSKMHISGSQVIDASRENVWKNLNDPQVLQKCIPGCDGIEVISPTEWKAVVVVKVGPVKASFTGEVKLSELEPPESCRIVGKGQGGIAGHASGGATVKLTTLSPTQTQLDYTVNVQIGGKLAMLGSRLIDSTAHSLADQFFKRFGSLTKVQGASSLSAIPKTAGKKPIAKKTIATRKPGKKTTIVRAVVKKTAGKRSVAKNRPASLN
jgi:uncharacterized protein